MTTKLYSVEGGTLEFDSSVPYLFATYEGFLTSENFQSQYEFGLTQISQKISEYGKVAWITDLRKSEIFNDSDVRWVNEYWNPLAFANGLRYQALIIPESIFASMNVEEYIAESARRKDPLVINVFSDVESAAAWCNEMLARK